MPIALTSGFPLGIFHILIAAEMFAIVTVFNILHKKGFSIVKWLFLVLTNGLISPMPFYFIISPQFYFASLPSLLIATIINVVVVILIMPVLNKILRQWKVLNL